MDDPRTMPEVVADAHNVLFHLSLTEESPLEEPGDVVYEFNEWVVRNEYDTEAHELQEMHVQSILPLDEQTAELVIEWARDVYPDIFM